MTLCSLSRHSLFCFFFFFNDTATTEIYTLSLHDALPIAAEMGGARSIPAFATALAWFGSGLGGIGMGYLADRYGVRWTVIFGSLMIGIGLAISSFGQTWQLYLGHGLFIGLLGNAGLNAPLYVYVSRWFDRRRGSALALIASGQYISGSIWPPIFEYAIAT